MTEKYREDTSKNPIVDSDVWIKIGGENKKGRVYDIGHSLDLDTNPHVSSSTVEGSSSKNPNATTEEITTLATQISNLQEQVKTQLQAHTDMQAQMKAQSRYASSYATINARANAIF